MTIMNRSGQDLSRICDSTAGKMRARILGFRPYLKNKTKENGEKLLDSDGAPILEEVDYKQMKIRGSTG